MCSSETGFGGSTIRFREHAFGSQRVRSIEKGRFFRSFSVTISESSRELKSRSMRAFSRFSSQLRAIFRSWPS